MLAPRIRRSVPQSAPRKRPGDSRSYIAWIKSLPCVLSGAPADDPHHLMRLKDDSGRTVIKGIGRRHPDRWCLPVRRWVHDALHAAGDDEALLASLGFDARTLCTELWSLRDDPARDEKARRLIDRARMNAKLKVTGWAADVAAMQSRHAVPG